jgi:hypothetical protein
MTASVVHVRVTNLTPGSDDSQYRPCNQSSDTPGSDNSTSGRRATTKAGTTERELLMDAERTRATPQVGLYKLSSVDP